MKKCSVEGCDKPHEAKGYCHTHYSQLKRYGKIRRTQKDKNEIVIHEDYAEIVLYNRKCEEIARTQISLESVPLVKDIKWRLLKTNYVEGQYQGKFVRLNRFLMNVTERGLEVDHIDRNPLNNRLSNLRICNRSQNIMNTSIRVDNKYNCKGISFDKRVKKWRATITVNKKTIYLGQSSDIDEVIKLRIEAEEKYFGEYRVRH